MDLSGQQQRTGPEQPYLENIYRRYPRSASVPHRITDAKINRAFITQGCIVEGEVKNSVLFTGTKVGQGPKGH